MTNEDSTGWARRVSENFGKGYTSEQLRDLDAAFSPLSEQDAERLYAHIKTTTRASFKVDMVAIREAKAQLGISDASGASGSPSFQTVTWICQACSKTYQFNYLPAESDEYREIFNFCPHCGFVPRLTLFLENGRVTYKGDQKMIERLKLPGPKGTSTIEYYRKKKGEFFDKVKERDSEIAMYANRGIDDDISRLAASRRFK
jgi:DNA-directed RNA polymerase subunit RPC12/RpoP